MASGIRYLALVRGINVGGKNAVAMAELREAFEALGFSHVSTYIKSGNVWFRGPRQKALALAGNLEAELSERFGIDLKVVVRTEAQLRAVVRDAPAGFGADTHRSDVIFLRRPLTARRAFPLFETKEGVDEVWEGTGVVYFTRLTARATSSRLSRIITRPEYQDMTIRSWGTVQKLLGLPEG